MPEYYVNTVNSFICPGGVPLCAKLSPVYHNPYRPNQATACFPGRILHKT